MAYDNLANYVTTNHSNRDITKDFDIKQFNINFEKNDKKLNESIKQEYKKPELQEIKDNCNNNYNNIYYMYGIIFLLIGIVMFLIGLLMNKYN